MYNIKESVGMYKMQIESFSGNINLQLPKALHGALAAQAEKEQISLNQLCLLYLSSRLAENRLGAKEFNQRLEEMERLYGNNEEMLFIELKKLNNDVEARKPIILKAIKEIYEKNPPTISGQMGALSYIFPIFYGDSKIPYIKIPSARIVLDPNTNQHIDVKEIKEILNGVPDTYVGAGDFQFYVPLERWEIDRSRITSVVVTLWCKFKDLFDLIQRVRNILGEAGYEDKAQISIKPFHLYDDARHFLEDIKGLN